MSILCKITHGDYIKEVISQLIHINKIKRIMSILCKITHRDYIKEVISQLIHINKIKILFFIFSNNFLLSVFLYSEKFIQFKKLIEKNYSSFPFSTNSPIKREYLIALHILSLFIDWKDKNDLTCVLLASMKYPDSKFLFLLSQNITLYRLNKIPYTSSAVSEFLHTLALHPQYSIIRSKSPSYPVIVYDTIFPSLHSSFSLIEINAYLDHLSCCVYTTGTDFKDLTGNNDTSFENMIQQYRKHYPQHVNRIYKLNPTCNFNTQLIVATFLSNAYQLIDLVEYYKIPLIFTLYSGGEFLLNDEISDKKLNRIFSSPFFKKVIVGQVVIRDYLLEKKMLPEDKIEFIYGPITNAKYLLSHTSSKKHYPDDKDTFDICFVAHKTMPQGSDKGYDIFIQVAKILIPLHPHIHFHVIGGFTKDDINIAEIHNNVHFYGTKPLDFFASFYSNIDIILSPSLPFVQAPGAFDGAPNVSTIEAGICGVAVFMTDQLGQNIKLQPNKDLVVIPHDAIEISRIITEYYIDPKKLYDLAEEGKNNFREVYSFEKQVSPRINLIKNLLKEG